MERIMHFDLRPSIRTSFSYGWDIVFGNRFLPLFLAVIIVGILNGPISANSNWEGDFNIGLLLLFPLIIFGLAYYFLFLPVLEYGEDYLFLKAVRNQETDLKLLFEGFRTKYLNIVLANLIVFALTMIGLMMLIVPGIIVFCRLAFVPYLVMDKDLDPVKAVEKSWELTRGYGWKVFGLALASIGIFICGLIVFLVGAIFSVVLIHAAFATFYQSLLNVKDEENPIPILGVNEV